MQKPGGGDYEAPPRVQLSDLYNIGHNDNYFDGKIDEVAFFDYALTATEVSALFSGQSNPTPLSPLFLGRFSPVLRRVSAVPLRCPASWRRDGENGRKMAENGRNLGEKRARNSGG